ncbi:hypothetical protein Tco_0520396 [Tanacetum coccineum]
MRGIDVDYVCVGLLVWCEEWLVRRVYRWHNVLDVTLSRGAQRSVEGDEGETYVLVELDWARFIVYIFVGRRSRSAVWRIDGLGDRACLVCRCNTQCGASIVQRGYHGSFLDLVDVMRLGCVWWGGEDMGRSVWGMGVWRGGVAIDVGV